MLGGCTVEVQEVDIPKEELQEYIYELALKTGYEGAYAEWVSSVKGETGADGKKVELSTTLTHIIWRYEGEAEWRELIAIEELHAEPGKSAYDITTSKIQLLDDFLCKEFGLGKWDDWCSKYRANDPKVVDFAKRVIKLNIDDLTSDEEWLQLKEFNFKK